MKEQLRKFDHSRSNTKKRKSKSYLFTFNSVLHSWYIKVPLYAIVWFEIFFCPSHIPIFIWIFVRRTSSWLPTWSGPSELAFGIFPSLLDVYVVCMRFVDKRLDNFLFFSPEFLPYTTFYLRSSFVIFPSLPDCCTAAHTNLLCKEKLHSVTRIYKKENSLLAIQVPFQMNR